MFRDVGIAGLQNKNDDHSHSNSIVYNILAIPTSSLM